MSYSKSFRGLLRPLKVNQGLLQARCSSKCTSIVSEFQSKLMAVATTIAVLLNVTCQAPLCSSPLVPEENPWDERHWFFKDQMLFLSAVCDEAPKGTKSTVPTRKNDPLASFSLSATRLLLKGVLLRLCWLCDTGNIPFTGQFSVIGY